MNRVGNVSQLFNCNIQTIMNFLLILHFFFEKFNLRFQLATGQLENHSRLSEVKREVARVLTEIRAREIAAAEAVGVVETEEVG